MSTSETPADPRDARTRRASKEPIPRGLSRLVEAGVWLILIATPWALGSVSERATALMEGGSFTLLILAWWGGMRRGKLMLPKWLIWPSVVFCAWTLFQLIPLPPAALQFLSPGTYRAYSRYLPGYDTQQAGADVQSWLLGRRIDSSKSLTQRAGESTGLEGRLIIHPGWRPISWYPWETARWLCRFLAYLAFLVLVSRFLPTRALEKRIPWLVVALGFGLSVFGIVQDLTWNGKVFWFIPVHQGYPFGPWVNRDHFSGYMEMALPLGCGIVLREMGVGRRRRRHRDAYRLAASKLALCGFMLAFMVAAMVLAGSRGGLFSLALTSSFYASLQIRPMLLRKKHRVAWSAVALAPMILCLGGIAFYVVKGREISAPESGLEISFAGRLDAWKGVAQMIASNPLGGTGLGTFSLAYPLYKTYGETSIWDQAHNDFLQLLAESGSIGFVLFLWGLTGFWRSGLWPRLSGGWRQQSPVVLGCCLGLVTLLAHSFVDFNLQIPSNGLLFIMLGGLVLAEESDEEVEKKSSSV